MTFDLTTPLLRRTYALHLLKVPCSISEISSFQFLVLFLPLKKKRGGETGTGKDSISHVFVELLFAVMYWARQTSAPLQYRAASCANLTWQNQPNRAIMKIKHGDGGCM